MSNKLPIIGIPADRRLIGDHVFHIAGEKYVRAVAEAAGAMPLIIPALAELFEFDSLLAQLDGLLFPGSLSNVEPHRYGGSPAMEPVPSLKVSSAVWIAAPDPAARWRNGL